MNFTEALKALYEGKKIRRVSWETNKAYQMKADKSLSYEGTLAEYIVLSSEDLRAEDWEAVEKVILLNQKEKEFLENVLRPYTDSYDITIEKKMGDENQYYLDIILFPHRGSDSRVERFCLPLSGVNEELMFRYLKKDYQYTSDDLNLFHE